jgi:dipeptidase D
LSEFKQVNKILKEIIVSKAIEGLKPELVWKYFAEISNIPRGSKNETAISAYVVATAKKLGLAVKVDNVGNVAVSKPGTAGKEKAPTIILQGHLDMVCEKNKDKIHDFEKDPIELVRDGNVLKANGTTLGADNGIGVSISLAIMEDKSLIHGPLEFLFTIDEETGLTGAQNLKSDFLKGTILMNLDSEEEGALYVGCSGGKDTLGTFKIQWENAPNGFVPVQISITGLRGGHSGLDINTGRGNALKLLNRVLWTLNSSIDLRLSKFEGGSKRNAIPREADAVIYIPKEKLADVKNVVQKFDATFKLEYSVSDKNVTVKVLDVSGSGKVVFKNLCNTVLNLLYSLPHGVIAMSQDIPELVETSTNVATINFTQDSIVIGTSQRSSVESEKHDVANQVRSVFLLAGTQVEDTDGYPGWKPNMSSKILQASKETYKKLFGKEPEVKAIHAGLECGIIGEKFPGMDMISMGPTMEAVHSPDEKIYIDTVEKFWKYLVEILKSVN